MVAGAESSSEAAGGGVGALSVSRVKAARAESGAGSCGRSAGGLSISAGEAAVCSVWYTGVWVESLRRADLVTGFITNDGTETYIKLIENNDNSDLLRPIT